MSAALASPVSPEPNPPPLPLAQALRIWEAEERPHPETRITWLLALRHYLAADPCLGQHPEHAETRARLLAVAVACDDLPLIRYLGGIRHALGEASLDEELDLVIACWRSGELEPALDLSRRLLFTHPYEARCTALYAAILATLRQPWSFPMPGPAWGDTSLCLVPLDHAHCDDFAWAYHDPEIAARCCLPRFADAAEWHAWVDDCRAFGDQMTFAVWHRDWGFIGSVSLLMAEDIGFFYYWIAADFQGLGLGPKAAHLLFELAETHWGLRVCYAKCFVANHPSCKALAKLGFTPVDLAIRSDRDGEQYYRRAPSQAPAVTLAEELRFLFMRMGSTARVLVPCIPRLFDFIRTT
jgi:RimJ/RimL family protein N-acetyltransferase